MRTDIKFKNYTDDKYDALCGFLIALNEKDDSHINWNWARLEWMIEHPEFDKSLKNSIGLWIVDDKIVGAAIYDMYFGEGFCGVLPEYKDLYQAVLEYACNELKDDSGFGMAICDENPTEIEMVQELGFKIADQDEIIMERKLDDALEAKLPDGLKFFCPDPMENAYELQWLFWQGFDHGDDKVEFEREEEIIPRIRKHFNKDLGVAAVNVVCYGIWQGLTMFMLSLYVLFPHIEEKALLRLLSLKRWAEQKSLEQKELTSFPIWNSMRGSALERSIIIHFGLRNDINQ